MLGLVSPNIGIQPAHAAGVSKEGRGYMSNVFGSVAQRWGKTPVLQDLMAAFPPGVVRTDPGELSVSRSDEAGLEGGTPLAVLYPRDAADVQCIVKIAGAHQVCIVAQGARTGLAGGADAVDGGLVVSMTRMDRILEISAEHHVATVQPGVITDVLREAVEAQGLYYPPDPGSMADCTIGGNVSTNAGGMCCVKYGTTREYVQSLQVVLSDGSIARFGNPKMRRIAGYDLVPLFVGAEGTLGLITEISLRLRPRPPETVALMATYSSITLAGEAVSALLEAGHTPSMLEVMDATHIRAIETYRRVGLDPEAAAVLLIGVDSGPNSVADLESIAKSCRSSGATETLLAEDPVRAQALITARRLAYPAMLDMARRAFPSGRGGIVVDDVAIPVPRVAELITGISTSGRTHGVTVGVVGHAGLGNLHPVIVVNHGDPMSVRAGRAVFDDIMAISHALGGSCAGEHGVGLLKREWLARELGTDGLSIHDSIKNAFDPAGMFNPGKMIQSGDFPERCGTDAGVVKHAR